MSVRTGMDLRDRFHTACLRTQTTMQEEVYAYVGKRILELEQLPVERRQADRQLRATEAVSVRMPMAMRDRFKELSRLHGYSLTEQLVEFVERRTEELDKQYQIRRQVGGYAPLPSEKISREQ